MGQIQSLTGRDVFGTAAGGECTAFKGAPLLSDSFVCVCVLWTTFIHIVSFIIDGSRIDQTFQFLGLCSNCLCSILGSIYDKLQLFALSIYCQTVHERDVVCYS